MEEALAREGVLLTIIVAALLAASMLTPAGLAAEKRAPPPRAPAVSAAGVVGFYAFLPLSLSQASSITPFSGRGFVAVIGSKLYSVDVGELRYFSRQLGAVPAAVAAPGYPASRILVVYPDGSAEIDDAATLTPVARITPPILCQSPVYAVYNGSAAIIACQPNIYLYVAGRPRPLTLSRLKLEGTLLGIYPVIEPSPAGGYRVGSLGLVAAAVLKGSESAIYVMSPGAGRVTRVASIPGRVVGAYLVKWGGVLGLIAASDAGYLLYASLGSPVYVNVTRIQVKPSRLWVAPLPSGYLVAVMGSDGSVAAYHLTASRLTLLFMTAAASKPGLYEAVAWPLLTPVLVVPAENGVRLVDPLTGFTVSLLTGFNAAVAVTPPDASYLILAPPSQQIAVIVRGLSRIASSGVASLTVNVKVSGAPHGVTVKAYVRAACISGPCLGSGQEPVEAPAPLHVQLLPGLYILQPIVDVGGLRAPAASAKVYLPPGGSVEENLAVVLAPYRVCVRSAGDPYGWGFKVHAVAGANVSVESSSGLRVGSLTTGKDGCVEAYLPAKGVSWLLHVSAKGYAPLDTMLREPGNYTLYLHPDLVPLYIDAVSRATGRQVPGAEAVILDLSTKRRAAVPVPITLHLPPGGYQVTVFAKGYSPVVEKVDLRKRGRLVARLSPSLLGLELLLQHGFVPMVTAEIHVDGYSIQGLKVSKTVRVRGDHASLTLPEGVYTIRVESPGFEPYSTIIVLSTPRLLKVNMKPLLTTLILYIVHKYWRLITAAIAIPVAAVAAYKAYKKLKPRVRRLIEKLRKGRKRKKREEVSLEELLAGGG